MAEKRSSTHRAYATKREGDSVRYLEIGVATMHSDGKGFDVQLDRLPIGGFNGYILVRPSGAKPDDSAATPSGNDF